MHTLMVFLPALLVACGAPQSSGDRGEGDSERFSFEGDLDGEHPQLVDGFFFHASAPWRNDEGIVVMLTSFPDACDALSELFEDLDEFDSIDDPESRAEAQAEAWDDALPDEFWRVDITMRLQDVGDSLSGEEIDGVDWGNG